jgi:hypothetical protein
MIGRQAPAVALLTELIAKFGDLPGGYVKIHQPVHADRPARLDLQLSAPHQFESWRAALGIAAADVNLYASTDAFVWLSAVSTIHGVPFELTGFGVPLTAKQAETPQTAAEVTA